MADYGIKIVREGKSVDSTDPNDFVFHSSYSHVKIVQEASGSIGVSGSTSATTTIPHGLDFTPMAVVYTETNPNSGRWYFGAGSYPTPSGDNVCYVDKQESYTNTSALTLTFSNNTTSGKTIKFYYMVFGDSGV